jgi:hypothetical protein
MSGATPTPRRPFPVRLFLWSLLLTFAGSGGIYLAYDLVIEPKHKMERLLAEKEHQITGLQQDNAKLRTYLDLLRHTERRARLEVLQQSRNAEGEAVNTLRFTEISPDGTPLGPSRDLQLVGDEVYLDTLVIKFEDHFVEENDPLKGHALVLLRRIFTNRVKPDDGYKLDRDGDAPEAYATAKERTPFERELWTKFWQVANDEALAKKYGVKAVHGQTVYGRLQSGKVYHLVMRSTGEAILPPPTDLKPN